jgi:hypothetical protein
MYCNYNVLVLPIEAAGKYEIGDTFKLCDKEKEIYSWQFHKFDGLKIENIDYCFGVRLHFKFSDWALNNPPIAGAVKVELKKTL